MLVLFVELASFFLFIIPVALGLEVGFRLCTGVRLSWASQFSLSFLPMFIVVGFAWFGRFCFRFFHMVGQGWLAGLGVGALLVV